ncbi:MAG: hypothetical protein HQM12_01350 [SAR324 cluster bacterium]|nr:hypothetical protein [SAR324 cluster bacterium]
MAKPVKKKIESTLKDRIELSEKDVRKAMQENLDFTGFQEKVIIIVEQINKQQHAKFLTRLKQKLIGGVPEIKNINHLDGSIIGRHHPNKTARSLVDDLKKDPTSSVSRLKLINVILEAERTFPLSVYRDIIIQSMIPVYLGDIALGTVGMVLKTYRLYLDKMGNILKQQMLTLRSKQLKNANLGKVDFKDRLGPENVVERTYIMELKIAQELLDRSAELMKVLSTRMTVSFNMDELNQLSNKERAMSGFFSTETSEADDSKRKQLLLKKLLIIIDILKQIPVLHSIGLKLVDKMKEIDDKLNYAHVLEGRIHMQALQYYLMRIEAGDYSMMEKLFPTYKKVIACYKKAMSLTSKTTVTKADLPVLSEFANATHYGYVHRDLFKITREGVLDLLRQGKEAIDDAVVIDPNLVRLQSRLIYSITESMEG